jgi:DNA polymerase I-like protein with 3'-5' exonuclease and polymerase domains
MVAEYILSGQDVSNREFHLSNLAEHYGMPPKLDVVKTQYWDCGIDTYDVPRHILMEYVLDDTQKTYDICLKQRETMGRKSQLLKLHMEFTKALTDMELNGFNWDKTKSREIYDEYIRKTHEIELDLHEIAGNRRVNFGSPKQLAVFLYGGTTNVSWKEWTTKEIKKDNATRYYEKKFEEEWSFSGVGFTDPRPKSKREGQPPTDKNTIKELKGRGKKQRAVKELLIKRSKFQKIAETIIGKRTGSGLDAKVSVDGKIHPKFNQAVTATGRLSSSDPNGQNFQTILKTCVVPEFDWMCNYDLSQVEWKGAGESSGDAIMIGEINDDIDQHNATGEGPFGGQGERKHWKIFNFRMIYGGSAYGFHMDSQMPRFGIQKWGMVHQDFWSKYYGLDDYNQRNIQRVLRGEVLQIFTGRTFVFNKNTYKDGIWQYSENQIKNYPIQGLAGGDLLPLVVCIIRRGMKAMGLRSKLFITVHDSVGFDSPQDEVERLNKLCCQVGNDLSKYIKAFFGYTCRVKRWGGDFEVGKNYGELEDYETWKKTNC